MRPTALLILMAVAGAVDGEAYVRLTTGPVQTQGAPLVRTDYTSIQFLVNTSMAAGAVNANGQTTITAGSDPLGAVQAAMNTWNAVQSSAARFAAPQVAPVANNPADGNHVITIQDTPENRSVAGDLLAVTLFQFTMDGKIVDTDIILNPSVIRDGVQMPFSSNHEINTVDLQSVFTHELGHALGANHSGLLSAVMFQSCVPAEAGEAEEATLWSTLSADDVAFVTTAYPATGSDTLFGRIGGTVSLADGTPVRGALITAIDASTGMAVGGISSLTDGTYAIVGVPPGNYQVYAEAMDAPVFPYSLYLDGLAHVDTAFPTGFFGGVDNPGVVALAAGGSGAADISVAGDPPVRNLQFIGVDRGLGIIQVADSARVIQGGQTVDVLLFGDGIGAGDTVRLVGPATMRTDSVHMDPSVMVNGRPALRFTADAAPVTAMASVAVVVNSGSSATTLSGGLVIVPAPPPTVTGSSVPE